MLPSPRSPAMPSLCPAMGHGFSQLWTHGAMLLLLRWLCSHSSLDLSSASLSRHLGRGTFLASRFSLSTQSVHFETSRALWSEPHAGALSTSMIRRCHQRCHIDFITGSFQDRKRATYRTEAGCVSEIFLKHNAAGQGHKSSAHLLTVSYSCVKIIFYKVTYKSYGQKKEMYS